MYKAASLSKNFSWKGNFTNVSNQGGAKNVFKIEEDFQISLKNTLKISFYSNIWLINEH